MSVMGDIKDAQELVGKTIATIEQLQGPHGSVALYWSAVTFTDGTRTLLACDMRPVTPLSWRASDIALKEARRCPKYFTPADLGEIVESQEARTRDHIKAGRKRDQQEIERLQRRLEESA